MYGDDREEYTNRSDFMTYRPLEQSELTTLNAYHAWFDKATREQQIGELAYLGALADDVPINNGSTGYVPQSKPEAPMMHLGGQHG